MISPTRMTGQTISHFEILEKLGEGGMGVVYKARDLDLDRFVALKVLPPQAVADTERKRRFIQEAKSASALNHPNIITVYEIANTGDTSYIAMEYVTGRTLDALASPRGFRLHDALNYATQIADALAVAHGAGIIHRDIKPANIMITDRGLAKVLDFGLAKLTEVAPAVDHYGDTVTAMATPQMTVEGTILGTASYMSPEQAEARPLDARSDIFSFGAVLYEMVTGQRPFQGSSAMSTITSVLRDDPRPVREFVPNVPPELESIIVRCLRKDPERRWQNIRDVRVSLLDVKDQLDAGKLAMTSQILPAAVAVPPVASGRKSNWLIAVLAGAAIFCAVAFWMLFSARSRPAQPIPPAPQIAQEQSAAKPSAAPPVPVGDPVLTNQQVLEMHKANLAANVIVSQIESAKTSFDLSTPELIRLAKEGVPEPVLSAMRKASGLPAVEADQVKPVELREGQRLLLVLAEDIPADADKGTPLSFRVADDVEVDDVVVIRRNAPAVGAVAGELKRKLLGRDTKMAVEMVSVRAVDGRNLRIRATLKPEGEGKLGKAVAVPGTTKDKNLVALRGASFTAYLDQSATITRSPAKGKAQEAL